MGNLYIWFATTTERRKFVLRLLEIPRLEKRNGTKKAEKEHRELVGDLASYLQLLDSGKTKSPYFNLYKSYYNGTIPAHEASKFTRPWDPPVVFKKGFRQIESASPSLEAGKPNPFPEETTTKVRESRWGVHDEG